jgi:hypothetical protein
MDGALLSDGGGPGHPPAVVQFVVRDGGNRWGSWGVVRRSAWLLVLVEAVCDGEVPTRNEKLACSSLDRQRVVQSC